MQGEYWAPIEFPPVIAWKLSPESKLGNHRAPSSVSCISGIPVSCCLWSMPQKPWFYIFCSDFKINLGWKIPVNTILAGRKNPVIDFEQESY